MRPPAFQASHQSVGPAAPVTSRRNRASGGSSPDPVRRRSSGRPLYLLSPVLDPRPSVCPSGPGSVPAGRVPCGYSVGSGRGGGELELGDQDGGGECKDPGIEKPSGGYEGDCDCVVVIMCQCVVV